MTLKQQQKHQHRRTAFAAPPSLPADMLANRIGTALQLHQAGDLPAAESIYREVLRLHSRHPDALHYLGTIHYQRGRLAEAAEWMERSIVAADTHGGRADFHSNYGLVLHDLGKLDHAAAAFARALKLRPEHPEALNNLGNTLQAQGKLDDALAHFRRAIDLRPFYVQAYCNAGAALKRQRKLTEAVEAYRTALRLNPRHAEAHYNLGNTLHTQGRLDEAVEHFRAALAERPNYPEAHLNWGNVLTDQGKIEEALNQYGAAVRLDPHWSGAGHDEGSPAHREENVFAHMNLAMARLLLGDFDGGLPEYEWRHRVTAAERSRSHPQPMWRGEPLHGRTIRLHWEQGLGDTLQMLRYASMVRARGGRVLLQVQPCIERLAASLGPEFHVAFEGEPMPPFDLQCPLLNLPYAFGTRLETIPAQVPYLRVPEEETAYAATLPWSSGLKVGLVWAGSPDHVKDKFRSFELARLAPLLEAPGVQFHSLQVGAAAAQLAGFPAIRNLAPDPANMADTAAKLAHLDLLIAADTAVVHLAGALGKPVWVMLPFAPDWRWLRGREDSPWYPSMRLFRQPERDDWISVVERVGEALREWVAALGYPDRDGVST